MPMTYATVTTRQAQARYSPSVPFLGSSFAGVEGLSADMISTARSAAVRLPASVMGEVCRPASPPVHEA